MYEIEEISSAESGNKILKNYKLLHIEFPRNCQ